jgi:hypothetical protein
VLVVVIVVTPGVYPKSFRIPVADLKHLGNAIALISGVKGNYHFIAGSHLRSAVMVATLRAFAASREIQSITRRREDAK